MPSKVPTCAAVVVSHNSAGTIAQCIESLQNNHVDQVIVVDNNSADATRRVVEKYQVTLIARPDNLGFAAACNEGARSVTAEYILFLNPDAYLTPRALRAALTYCDSHPRVGVAGLQLLDTQGHPEPNAFGDAITLGTLLRRKMRLPAAPSLTPRRCGWVSGGAMLVRRATWEKVGGFDEGYFLYWEDVDFCTRVRAAGDEVVWLPAAVAIHQRGYSVPDQRRKTMLYDASADRYFRTHYAGWIWVLQRCLRRLFRLFSPQVR